MRSCRALRELSRGERALEVACRALAAYGSGFSPTELLRDAVEHAEAARFLEGLLDEPPLSVQSLAERARTLAALWRGRSAIGEFLVEQEYELLHRYTGRLPFVEGPRRLEIQQRIMPTALDRLSRLDRYIEDESEPPPVECR